MVKSDKFFGSHEIQVRQETIKGGSDRSFGIVFAAVFGMIGASSWYYGGRYWLWWFAGSSVFAVLAISMPKLLGPLNRAWTKLGLLMFMVISPVVLGFLFYLCIMPTGITLRLLGKDLLSLKLNPKAKSYWIARAPPGPKPDSLANQF